MASIKFNKPQSTSFINAIYLLSQIHKQIYICCKPNSFKILLLSDNNTIFTRISIDIHDCEYRCDESLTIACDTNLLLEKLREYCLGGVISMIITTTGFFDYPAQA